MTDLPEVNGYNAFMVVVDKMGKFSWLVPCRAGENQLTAPQVAKLFFKNWFRFFAMLKYIIHDMNIHFTVSFWKVLWSIMGTGTLFSSAYHP